MIPFPAPASTRAPTTPTDSGGGLATGRAAATQSPAAPDGLVSRRERVSTSPPRASIPSALDLDRLYGPLQAPRAKAGQSAIQWQELAQDGITTVIHPRRSVFALGTPSADDTPRMQQVRQSVQDGRPHKWIIDGQGALIVGPTTVTPEEWPAAGSGLRRAEYLGHTTLVGGSAAPQGRIGGEWHWQAPAGDAGTEGSHVIDNNSGRYSEFTHLEPRHLENVADRFRQLDCPVDANWIDMQARRKERQAIKAARAAASSSPALPGAAATHPPH
jgi:hypothetical protein